MRINKQQLRPSELVRRAPALTLAGVLACLLIGGLYGVTRAATDTPQGVIGVTALSDQYGSASNACSLREAIETATSNADFGGCSGSGGSSDTIMLGAGTHTLSINGALDDSNATGDIDVTSALSIIGLGPISTTIEAGAAFTDRLIHIGLGRRVVISGVRLAGANAGFNAGAAIYVEGQLFLSNCDIDGNQNNNGGGGIYVAPTGYLSVESCVIRNNLSSQKGGGILIDGTVIILDSEISGNSVDFPSSKGGGIALESGALTLIRTIVANNSAIHSGGGLNLASTAQASIIDSTIRGNSAPDSGGISLVKGSLNMINSAIISNTSISAAGMRVTNTLATLVNSTVSGNVAQAGAGGIAVNSANGRLYLYNTTIANNTTNAGASGGNGGGLAIQAGSTVSMTGSVLADNKDLGASGDTPDCSGTIHLVAYNHVENTAGCTITGPATGNVTGSDPNLRALANNGGPTLTHLPNAGSPLVDSGDPAGCADQNGGILTTDQRGFFRPVNGGSALRCDKGSAERGSFQMRLVLPMIAR